MKTEKQKFPRVEVHFEDSKGQARVAVIAADDDRVKAIFLHGAEDQFLVMEKDENGKSGREVRKGEKRIPDGVKLLPEDGINEGPRGVCYVENGQYKCWGRR